MVYTFISLSLHLRILYGMLQNHTSNPHLAFMLKKKPRTKRFVGWLHFISKDSLGSENLFCRDEMDRGGGEEEKRYERTEVPESDTGTGWGAAAQFPHVLRSSPKAFSVPPTADKDTSASAGRWNMEYQGTPLSSDELVCHVDTRVPAPEDSCRCPASPE